MAKQLAEWSNSLSIQFLKKHGYLREGIRYGGISWTFGSSENKNSIGFLITIGGHESDNIRLQYRHTDRHTGEQENLDIRVGFTTTRCNYGGKRYWFICPLTKNGTYCGRRVGVLYSIGKWYGCRHCGEIAYSAQNENRRFRFSSVTIPDVEKAEDDIKRYFYNGKPTRKYRRYLRLEEKLMMTIMVVADGLNATKRIPLR